MARSTVAMARSSTMLHGGLAILLFSGCLVVGGRFSNNKPTDTRRIGIPQRGIEDVTEAGFVFPIESIAIANHAIVNESCRMLPHTRDLFDGRSLATVQLVEFCDDVKFLLWWDDKAVWGDVLRSDPVAGTILGYFRQVLDSTNNAKSRIDFSDPCRSSSSNLEILCERQDTPIGRELYPVKLLLRLDFRDADPGAFGIPKYTDLVEEGTSGYQREDRDYGSGICRDCIGMHAWMTIGLLFVLGLAVVGFGFWLFVFYDRLGLLFFFAICGCFLWCCALNVVMGRS